MVPGPGTIFLIESRTWKQFTPAYQTLNQIATSSFPLVAITGTVWEFLTSDF